jgi:hypothetical protein
VVSADGQRIPDHRNGEAPAAHFRSGRAIYVNGQWFISTREGIEVGPYPTRDDADSAAADLATLRKDITDPEITRQFVVREFMLVKWAQRRVARSDPSHWKG